MPHCGMCSLVSEALNQVNRLFRGVGKHGLSAVPHHGTKEFEICSRKWATIKRGGAGRSLGAIVRVLNFIDLELGIRRNGNGNANQALRQELAISSAARV